MIENNTAIIAKITNLRSIPNADRLLQCTILGSNIIVGINTKEGDLGVFFPEGMQLSEQFANANDLVRRKDENGNNAGGMFDPNRKVRTQQIRGVRSEGFWIPLNSLKFTGYDLSKLKEGDSFTSINGVEITNKYLTPASVQRKTRTQRSTALAENAMMKRHFDTQQLARNLDSIPVGAKCYITLKMHGTSGRAAHVELPRTLKWYEKLLIKLGVKIQTTEWAYIHGSRNVVLFRGNPDYHGVDFRRRVANQFEGKLKKGEAVYFEIVGYQDENTPIMGVYDNKDMPKEFRKQYGDTTIFSYGNPPGNFDIYIYRITQAQFDGSVTELSFKQVESRAKELGFKPVPTLHQPVYYSADCCTDNDLVVWHDDRSSFLIENIVEPLSQGPDPIGKNHEREGVCVRWEKNGEMGILKYKGFPYKMLEGLVPPEKVELEDVS